MISLKILLPFKVFLDKKNILSVVVETHAGSYGFLPKRLDCITAMMPGILVYHDDKEEARFLAIDEGVLIKTNEKITVSTRNAVEEKSLDKLHEAVENEFTATKEEEKKLRSILTKMESNLIVSLSEILNE